MCGISGFLGQLNISKDELVHMNDTMIHRGPDDSGVEIYDVAGGKRLGLAQRRLAILDLSALGHQPMHSKNKRVSLVYNGEIYNFLELKKEITDYEFISTCDTEVIIAAYLKWGKDFVNHIHGMFAIALYDRETDELLLIRDRIGKKPLYYYDDSKGNVIFASELKPIIESPCFEKKINKAVVGEYMFNLCIDAPKTIFKNVYKVRPGEIIIYKNGKKENSKYWDIANVYKREKVNQITSYEEAKDTLKKALNESVKKRMISDVPLGAFLSGGYDSSLITAIAQDNSENPVKTFSIGFEEEQYNEAKYAKAVAKHLGTNHTEIILGENEMLRQISDIYKYYDEPFADSSQIATMLVSKLAREQVTVALSGDGGDEFFCGYNVYPFVDRAQKIDVFGAGVNTMCSLPGIRNLNLIDRLPFRVQLIAKNRDELLKTQIGGYTYIDTIYDILNEDSISTSFDGLKENGIYNSKMSEKQNFVRCCKYPIEDRYEEDSWLIKRMLVDMDTYIAADILCKVDRASMKYSLESRCPILDTNVMELSFRIPQKYKYDGKSKKKILKDIAYDYIPKELLERPKTGFAVPIDKWLHSGLREELLTYASRDFLEKQNIFNAEETAKFIDSYISGQDAGRGTGKNYSKVVWAFFALQQWYSHYISN